MNASDQPRPGVRAQRKAETARQVHLATLDLVEAQGLEHVTVAQIAARAGISERTFFRYFDSKESATLIGHDTLLDMLQEFPIPAGTPAQIYAALLRVSREQFDVAVRPHEFTRVSRIILEEPRLLRAIAQREMELLARLGTALTEQYGVDAVDGMLVAELLASGWRVAWISVAREVAAGRDFEPQQVFDRVSRRLAALASAQLPD
ncbi:TetR/AcrR family transcriptional regulator [Glutamicibacter endophyticus]